MISTDRAVGERRQRRARLWRQGRRGGVGGAAGRAVMTPTGACGVLLTLAIVLFAVIGPLLKPDSPTASLSVPFSSPSGASPLGTDVLGRDVLSRLLDGGWHILLLAVVATLVGVLAGAAIGMTAAYARGVWDGILMRLVDLLLAFPGLILALLLMSLAGPSFWLTVVAVSLSHAPQVARVTRSASLDLVERDFVKAAEMYRVPWWRIIRRELLPSLSAPLSVEFGLRFGYSVIFVSGLAYLGFGQAPPAADWGVMISENQTGFSSNAWAVLAPCIMIALLTVGVSMFTDAMAQAVLARGGDEILMEEIDAAQLVAPAYEAAPE